MKRVGLLLVFVITHLMAFSQTEIQLLSYNIRFNNPMDGVSAWPKRRTNLLDSLRHLNGSIYCFQEVLAGQFNDLQKGLPEYEAYGVGRDNGKRKGEMVPIFYKISEWICLEKGSFWLSETPEKPGKGWDANLPRIVSWVKLKSKSNGKILLVFNTHFDHKGQEARIQSGLLLKSKTEEIAGNEPYVVCGDLNLNPEHSSYAVLTQSLNDSRKVAVEVLGTDYSFAGFEIYYPPFPLNRIDYIFTHKSMKIKKYDCPDWKNDTLHWLSDHRPVVIQFNPFPTP